VADLEYQTTFIQTNGVMDKANEQTVTSIGALLAKAGKDSSLILTPFCSYTEFSHLCCHMLRDLVKCSPIPSFCVVISSLTVGQG
jgi:hypothetical protein